MAHDWKVNGKQFYFDRRQLVILALAFSMTAPVILVFGVITGKTIAHRGIPTRAALVVKIPVDTFRVESDPEGEARPAENTGFENALAKGAADQESSLSAPELPGKTASAETTNLTLPVIDPAKTVGVKSVGEAASAAAVPEETSSQSEEGQPPDQIWTVQVKSSPDKAYVERWVDRLKSKGYDAFMTEADIKGQIWYRLRVGHFAGREEAESFQNTFESQEGLAGSFLLQQTK